MGKRTKVDWSKHEIHVTKLDGVLIHHFKQPNTIINNVKFINTNGIMAVTGDFGNWIFCREFHPSAEGYVSGGYWDEKLEIASEQKSHKFDSDTTMEYISEFEKDFEERYGREMNDEEKDWIEELKNSVDDEFGYIYVAYRQNPSTIDYEDVPFGKKRHQWLNIIYDAFDEICSRLKTQQP